MPSATIADTPAFSQSSSQVDTPSGAITGTATDLISALWQPRFPSAELVDQAAALLPAIREAADEYAVLTEGPRSYIRIGPGMIQVGQKDYARAERADERALQRRCLEADLLAAWFEEHGEFPEDPDPTRVISEWSRKSRTNMVKTLGQIDFTPMYADGNRLPGMLTLTYPGDWLTVAPTGKVAKAQLKALRKRYKRAWGEDLLCVWKLEFQDRGAPHFHMLMVPPHGQRDGEPFYLWVRRAWAEIVNHPDPEEFRKHSLAGTRVDFAEGLRASDPKRVAVYFLKHSTFAAKEYQHIVPEEWQEAASGPGRFWGYWGLEKATASVQVDTEDAITAGRTLRRWSAAKQVTREARKPRVKGGRAIPKYPEVIGIAGLELLRSREEPKYRTVRTRAKHMANNRGFVMVNDGPAMAVQLAFYLDTTRMTPEDRPRLDPARLPK